MTSLAHAHAAALVADGKVTRVRDARTFLVDGYITTLSETHGPACTCSMGRLGIRCQHMRVAEDVDQAEGSA